MTKSHCSWLQLTMQTEGKKSILVCFYQAGTSKSRRCFMFSDLRQATFCWGTTVGVIVTLGKVSPLPPATRPPTWGLMGKAKLVGGAGEGLWKRLLARSSRTRSGSGRSVSESLPLSYSRAHWRCASEKALWDTWLSPSQPGDTLISPRQSFHNKNERQHRRPFIDNTAMRKEKQRATE